MKLSDFTTGQAADALVQITPLIANIAGDENAVNALGRVADLSDMNNYGVRLVMAERYASFVTVLLKDHRADVFGILAALNLKSVAEIEAQKFTLTLREIRENIVEDEELMDFLASFMPMAKTLQSAPSAPVPDTSAQEESSAPSQP